MKITVQIEMELPEFCESFTDHQIYETLHDSLLGYAHLKHLCDQLKWIVKGDSLANKKIVDYHEEWASICKNAKMSIIK